MTDEHPVRTTQDSGPIRVLGHTPVSLVYLIGVLLGFVTLLYSEPISPTGTVVAGAKIVAFLVIWTAVGLVFLNVERRLFG